MSSNPVVRHAASSAQPVDVLIYLTVNDINEAHDRPTQTTIYILSTITFNSSITLILLQSVQEMELQRSEYVYLRLILKCHSSNNIASRNLRRLLQGYLKIVFTFVRLFAVALLI